MPEPGQLIHLRQRRGGMRTSIVGKASKYTIAALLVHAACDDLGLYVVTGHLGLFQRMHSPTVNWSVDVRTSPVTGLE